MCDPAGIASFGISAATSVMGGISQGIQTKNAALQQHTNDMIGYWKSDMESRIQTKQFELNKEMSRSAFESNLADIGVQEQQIQQSAAETKQAITLNTRQQKATASAAAGENGVGGISIESVLADMTAKSRNSTSLIDQQTEWDLYGSSQAKKQAGAQAIGRTFSMAPGVSPIMPTYTKPSNSTNMLSAGLQILSSGISGYTSANQRISAGQTKRVF